MITSETWHEENDVNPRTDTEKQMEEQANKK